MDFFFRPTRVEISLDALRHNYEAFREILPPSMKIMAVVKANGYGHGAQQIAVEALDCGADYLAVAFLDEAVELREAGIAAPILVLGYTPPAGLEAAAKNDITLTVYSDEMLEALRRMDTADEDKDAKCVKIHIKLDTGMGRIGLYEEESAVRFIEKALELKSAVVEGLFTHYASADEADPGFTHEQHRRFARIVERFKQKGLHFPYIHAGNSATAIQFPELSYNMVRLGVSMYGMYPSEEVDRRKIALQPVMSFKSAVVMSKVLPPDSGVSYGAVYRTKGKEQIATLPVGYADGFTRMLNGHAQVLLRGQKVPVVGRICMDQCMIQVDGLPDVRIGEEVVIIGAQGDECITADDLARTLGTINYEITCMISSRVPRVYIRNGEIVEVVNHLLHGIFSKNT